MNDEQREAREIRKHELAIEKLKTKRANDVTAAMLRGGRAVAKWTIIGGVAGYVCHKLNEPMEVPEDDEEV